MAGELMDAPNQQAVRPDGSGPGGDEGTGGSTHKKPAKQEEQPKEANEKATKE